MSRPKSSWAEIFAAVGALGAASAGSRTAREVAGLRAEQASALADLQEHLEAERQRREREEQELQVIRSLKQALFEFSEYLPQAKREIEGFFPDLQCAAAAFYESGVGRYADNFHQRRELLESYEDKRLIKTARDASLAIQDQLEGMASCEGLTLDQVLGRLFARRSETLKLRELIIKTRSSIEDLSSAVSQGRGTGPQDFLPWLTQLRALRVSAGSAVRAVLDAQRTSEGTLAFVSAHPRVVEIWPETRDVAPRSLHELGAQLGSLVAESKRLDIQWTAQKQGFDALEALWAAGDNEAFLRLLDSSARDLQRLPQVTGWATEARRRLHQLADLREKCKQEMERKNWRGVKGLVLRARQIPHGDDWESEIFKLRVQMEKGLFPRHLAFLGLGLTLAGALFYAFGALRLFLAVVGSLCAALLILFLIYLHVGDRLFGIFPRDHKP